MIANDPCICENFASMDIVEGLGKYKASHKHSYLTTDRQSHLTNCNRRISATEVVQDTLIWHDRHIVCPIKASTQENAAPPANATPPSLAVSHQGRRATTLPAPIHHQPPNQTNPEADIPIESRPAEDEESHSTKLEQHTTQSGVKTKESDHEKDLDRHGLPPLPAL